MSYTLILIIWMIIVPQIIGYYYPSFRSLSVFFAIMLLPIVSNLAIRYSNNRKKGMVTSTGLKRNNEDNEIAFAAIKSIAGNQGLQNIFTDNTSVEIHLPKQEIVKLSQDVLKNWTVNRFSINILPTTPDVFLTVIYAPVGKYTFNFLVMIYLWMIGIFFIHSVYWLFGLALGMWIHSLLQKYPQITVKIHDAGVSVIEKSNESFIPFSDIQTVKKNMFYIKIYTKDKRSFVLPKQCLYLYEFLILYSSIKNA